MKGYDDPHIVSKVGHSVKQAHSIHYIYELWFQAFMFCTNTILASTARETRTQKVPSRERTSDSEYQYGGEKVVEYVFKHGEFRKRGLTQSR